MTDKVVDEYVLSSEIRYEEGWSVERARKDTEVMVETIYFPEKNEHLVLEHIRSSLEQVITFGSHRHASSDPV